MVGHLGRFGIDPLELIEEGARLGKVFELRLWRRAVVGYSPDWNRLVLKDLDTFRSRGSLSQRTPYLAGGAVLTDAPEHRPRRTELNPAFHARALEALRADLREVVAARVPTGDFEACAWASATVQAMLQRAFFGTGPAVDPALLARFVRPLDQAMPAPLLPRPLLFRRMTAAVAAATATAPAGSLAAHVRDHVDRAVEEIRVSFAAGYDTTTHTLSWALWHLAAEPSYARQDLLPDVLDETLRSYPVGWLGSRETTRPVVFDGVEIPARTLVFYAPWLTHHDPELWPDPYRFDPDRFARGATPAWGFVPFAAGERMCLGANLARLMLMTALEPFCDGRLRAVRGEPEVRTGLTLLPRGQLQLRR
jgi:cytochrome P450